MDKPVAQPRLAGLVRPRIEPPELFSRLCIERDDPVSRSSQEQGIVDGERCRLELARTDHRCPRLHSRDGLTSSPSPHHSQLPDIRAVDVCERRIPHPAGVAPVRRPLNGCKVDIMSRGSLEYRTGGYLPSARRGRWWAGKATGPLERFSRRRLDPIKRSVVQRSDLRNCRRLGKLRLRRQVRPPRKGIEPGDVRPGLIQERLPVGCEARLRSTALGSQAPRQPTSAASGMDVDDVRRVAPDQSIHRDCPNPIEQGRLSNTPFGKNQAVGPRRSDPTRRRRGVRRAQSQHGSCECQL